MSKKRKMTRTVSAVTNKKLRKYDNDYCKMIAKSVNDIGLSKTSRLYGLRYDIVQYINKQYYVRMARGEYDARKKANTTSNTSTPKGRVYLKPRVVGFADTDTAWKVMEKHFTDEQLDIVTKFYNTVLFDVNAVSGGNTISANYEKV